MPLKILALFLSLTLTAEADDTELFVKTLPGVNQPNVLLLIDTSGSMVTTYGYRTRMDIVQEAVRDFLNDAKNVNISLMSFNSWSYKKCVFSVPLFGCVKYSPVVYWRSHGGNIDFASEDIATGLQGAIGTVNGYSPDGFTPLSESLYEAYTYFAGHAPVFGQNSVSASISNSSYKSPIVSQCQKNSIVIFTDGDPHDDSSANAAIQSKIRGKSLPGGLSSRCSGHGGCLDELAWYLSNHDVRPDLPGDQTITTYTIGGFGVNRNLLVSTAYHGGGRYYESSSVSGLSGALSDALLRVNAEDSTFAAPATSVSAVNALETAEDVYFVVFKPSTGPGWIGNLKRYRLGRDNQLYDANGSLAIDPATGFFASTAKSFWSSSVDGKRVELGGMAEKLSQSRPVFTNTNGDTNVNLSSFANRLHETNSNITGAMLGAATIGEISTILRWGRGVDVGDQDNDGSISDDRTSIGDPIHTQPQVITYYKNKSGSTVDKTVFFTTNDGFLHAVNTDNGTTEFSFIPQDLLVNLKMYWNGSTSSGAQKAYGMDGPMTAWIHDANGDGDVLSSNNGSADSGDHIYLYLTMRRGGNNIYALDVTNRSQPVLKWVIRGDIDNDHYSDPTGNFGRLGQTWSTPKLAQVNWNGSLRHVLLFGGGYDVAIDGHTTIQNSNIGNAIFMVDALSGQMLWRASNNNSDLNIADMNYSIPASLTPLDMDRDGAVDMFFVGDTGGQVFRFDINQSNSGAANFATGGVIAKLAGNTALDARRFFEPVAVALGKEHQYLNIALGSGYRPSPLSTDVNDRMYVIQDPHVASAPSSYGYVAGQPYTEANLYNATDNLLQQGTSAQRSAALSSLTNANGWYMKLEESGEKVLSKAVIYNGVLLFNSFAPLTSTPAVCLPVPGVNRLYAVNIENGAAVFNLDASGGSALVKADRSVLLNHPSLAPSPTIISRGSGGAKVCVGTNCLQNTLDQVDTLPVIRRFWRENR